jgi:hypothetical protein
MRYTSRDREGATERSYLVNVRPRRTHCVASISAFCVLFGFNAQGRTKASMSLPDGRGILAFPISRPPFDHGAGHEATCSCRNCAVCHGADAGGSDRGPALTNNRRLRYPRRRRHRQNHSRRNSRRHARHHLAGRSGEGPGRLRRRVERQRLRRCHRPAIPPRAGDSFSAKAIAVRATRSLDAEA